MSRRVLFLALIFLFTVPAVLPAQDFVGVSGTQFTFQGKPFYYAGTNNYYLGIDPGSSTRAIDEVLTDAKAMGLSVVRTWGFNDGTGGLQTAPGVYDEALFQKLDYTVKKAGDLGLKLIIPFVNNWDDYGGMTQYAHWAGSTGHDSFYTDAQCRTYYKNHVSALLNRTNTYTGTAYKDDPAIMAWELANEPRAANGGTLKNWVADMSTYVKGIDANHLLTTGVEGKTMADFRALHRCMPDIDFATMHIYPDYWGMNLAASQQYVDERIVEAKTMLRMPVILEEFGKYRDTTPPVPEPAVPTGGTGHTATRDQFYQGLYDVVRENHGDGSNFWILYHDTYPDYDGMGVYSPADTTTTAIIQAEASKMTVKNAVTQAAPLFDFGTGTQGWQCDWGGLELYQTELRGFPVPAANGALEVTGLVVDGTSGWVDGGAVRFIPWNWGVMDFSGEAIETFALQVFAPDLPGEGDGLKASFYIHTGNGWDWHEGAWFDLALGQWSEIFIETEGLDLASLRDFGVHFAADGTTYEGPVYLDYLTAETAVPLPAPVILFGSGVACLIGIRRRRSTYRVRTYEIEEQRMYVKEYH